MSTELSPSRSIRSRNRNRRPVHRARQLSAYTGRYFVKGAASSSLQEIGWSGRHPRGRETRRNRLAGSVSGPSAPPAFVVRADALSPGASLRLLSASGLIAGLSRPTTTRSQAVAPRAVGLRFWRRDALQAPHSLYWPFGCSEGRSAWSASIGSATSPMSSCSPEGCLLLAVLKARDAALRPPSPRTED